MHGKDFVVTVLLGRAIELLGHTVVPKYATGKVSWTVSDPQYTELKKVLAMHHGCQVVLMVVGDD